MKTNALQAHELLYPDFANSPPSAGLDKAYQVASVVVDDLIARTRSMGFSRYAQGLVSASVTNNLTGVHFNLFTGGETVSDELIVLHFNAMGKGLNPTRTMSEVMRQMASLAGARDSLGLPPAVVNFSAATGPAGVRLSAAEKRTVNHGDLGPIVRRELAELLKVTPKLSEIIIAGVSYGGARSAATARVAHEFGLKVQSTVTAVPGNAVCHEPRRLITLFNAEVEQGDFYINHAKPNIWRRNEADEGLPYWSGMARRFGANVNILMGLAAGWYGRDLIMAHRLNPEMYSYTMYATHDLITRRHEHTTYAVARAVNGDRFEAFEVNARHPVCHDPRIIGAILFEGFDEVFPCKPGLLAQFRLCLF